MPASSENTSTVHFLRFSRVLENEHQLVSQGGYKLEARSLKL